jgi:hypothetical protein
MWRNKGATDKKVRNISFEGMCSQGRIGHADASSRDKWNSLYSPNDSSLS